jgi:nicotinamide-nucleotide amidase
MVAAVEEEARQKLGNHVFGTDKETLSGVAGKLLQQRGWQIATMESCTGGMLANILTDVPGSSNYMRGGIVSYATDIKVAMGVPQETIDTYGVISEETALAMAAAACQQLGSQVGVGITGVAGPDIQEGKPVGQIHIGVVSPLGANAFTANIRGARDDVKRRAAMRALDALRLHLLELL